MSRVAIAFSTKDRVELTRRSIKPLQSGDFDTFVVDGSVTAAGQQFARDLTIYESHFYTRFGIRGGADAAIVYGLTTLLDHPKQYGAGAERFTHVGLCENDVLLHPGWFAPTMALFERGLSEGLHVGAVSARCYEDRILIQRDGYAVCHNLGAGHVIFTREAARLVLDQFRTSFSDDNRLTFGQLSGLDIARWWAFRGNKHWLTADWGFDAALARAGLASLALTPSPCEMIGQIPPLHEQGLKLTTEPVELLRDDAAFAVYRRRLGDLWCAAASTGIGPAIHQDVATGVCTIFPHQLGAIGGTYDGAWSLQWTQGFGPFSWVAQDALAHVTIPISGPCEILVGGGRTGGAVEVSDDYSGYSCAPTLKLEPKGGSQILSLPIPGTVVRRDIHLAARTPGVVFYGVRTSVPQLIDHRFRFDYLVLPPAIGDTHDHLDSGRDAARIDADECPRVAGSV